MTPRSNLTAAALAVRLDKIEQRLERLEAAAAVDQAIAEAFGRLEKD